MDANSNGLDHLTKQVVDKRVGGFTFEEIAEVMEIPTTEVVSTWRDYIDNRSEMSPEEQRVLHELRLENLLTKAHARLTIASEAEDYELILKLLDRVEALQALNKARKGEAQEALEQLTRQQTQLILTVMMQMQNDFRAFIDKSMELKTIKAIKGELVDNFQTNFTAIAQKSLSTVGEM
jgi:hypothetical protein